ncbi:protein piccolo-like isoform X1 [Melanaphis sacchari]|uniref:protein piccolo-like isoform X1 n=1 Tax=Melanaphis sacchari TaxID=742174 RepID=UPI000DC134EB|nr:protein piccolo-like isoform X1 [Melanaphis sacchari]XP_025190681.1 protein piccolo-like isoform X1 [Melanaphis sacchari]
MDSGFSNMLENTRKYFQGIPTDAASTAAAAAAAAAAQLHFPPPLPPSHHLHHNGGGGGRSSMNSSSSSSSSSSEPSSAAATDRFAGYHHPHLRYNFQPYSSPGHYPRTAVDPKPAAFQHHHFQPPSTLQYHQQQQQHQQQLHQLPLSASSSSPPSPYKSPYTLQPLPPPPLTVKQQQPPPSQFKPMSIARSSPPAAATDKQYSPPKPPQSPYAVVPKPTPGAPQPQSPFTAPKEQQPSVPETPPPSPHSSHYYNRTSHSGLQQQAIDRDYLRFKPIQTPPPPPNRFQPLEKPKSEVPATSGTGLQSSHLAIRYDPKLEQPRSGVRAVPIAQAKQPSSSSSSTTAVQHDVNRVIVQKPEPLRYHQQQQQQQHQLNNNLPHRSSSSSDDNHHRHHKRPASVQPSYLDSRPFQIKAFEGGGNNNSNGSSSNGSSGSGQSSSTSSYHRPFAVAPQPLPPSSQSSPAIIVSSMDHRWTAFDGRAPPAFLQQSSSSSAAAVINGYHHHHHRPSPILPSTSSSLPTTVVTQHHQHHSLSRQQQQSQHYPLNLQKLTQPARPATAAGQLQQPVKLGQENGTSAAAKLRFETTKRESPLDLSVKTVCRSADSTDDRLNPFGHDIPKVNFKPDFNRSLPATAAAPPPPTSVVVVGGQQHQQHNNAATVYNHHHHQFAGQMSLSLPPPTALPPPPSTQTVVVVQSSPQQPLPSAAAAPTTPLPPIVRPHHHPHTNNTVPSLSSADEAWRAAIDRQIEQKFNSYTSSKKHHPHPLHQYPQILQHQHLHHPPIPSTAMEQHQQQPPAQPPPPPPPSQQQQPQQGPAQADKRVLEILKQNIEARDQNSRPQIAEAPSTPAMVFSTPIRKEPSTTPLKKTDYYMAERTAVTPFPKKVDYYMDRAYCNAPRIRTKAERKQISAEGSSSGTRMSSPMAAATAISPHPFLPSNNSVPQTKQEPTPLTQTEAVIDLKLDIKREPSPIKEPDLSLLNKEETVKDEDDEDFWTNTCNSFVVQLAETQEKKKVKTPVKRKSPKELLPQPPKRKYTKRIKIEPIAEIDKDNKLSDVQNESKSIEEVKLEKSSVLENIVSEEKTQKDAEPPDTDKENKTKLKDSEKIMDDTKDKEDNEKKSAKGKPRRKRLIIKPLIAKVKKIKKEHKKELKIKELKKETKKEEKKELKKAEKKDKDAVKKEQLLKLEKKEQAMTTKEEKKGLKKEEKRDLKKDQQQLDHGNKKDLNNKKESKKSEANRKKVVVEKENLTKNIENTSRRSAAATAIEVAGKFNPRQSLRRKNSLKDYTFAFDELLDDAFAHFETVKIPVKRRRKCASPSPTPAPTVVSAAVGPTQLVAVVKKTKEKDNETIRMRLRSRNRPLLAKQEPQQASSKKKANVKNKIIPKRRRKKSLGEKSTHTVVATTEDWKDELYKFKRSLRLPSKLISVVSPPTAGAVAADQVSLTSIMNIPPPPKPVKESKAAKLAACQSLQAGGPGGVSGKNKPKRLGGHMFGRRDVMFKGRRMMKREKIVSAEKLMQRNLRKRRQREDEVMKKECAGEEAIASHFDDEDEEEAHAEEEDEEDDDSGAAGTRGSGVKPPARMLFKRKLMRKKFRSGFDYIKKKKKKEPLSDKKPATVATTTVASTSIPPSAPRYVSEIHAEIKGWIVNKGHGETVLHRAARLGVDDVVGYCIEKLEYAPSVADNAGYTPLHEACSQGHYHIAKLLLLFGADVSASAQGGIRPLHEAVENGDVHLVRLLLSYGADPHLATYSGQSPLSLATDKQTRMLLEHHVNDVQGYGSASVWNFDDSTLTHEPEDVDRLLWCLPPAPSPVPGDEDPSFEFEFADQSLPDVYKLSSDESADNRTDDDDWVLFADVSTALSVKTVDALVKLLDDENAVTAVPADRFKERAVLRKSLGRQPVAVPSATAANRSGAAERPAKDDNSGSVAAKEASFSSTPSTSASAIVSTSSTTTSISTTATTASTTSAVSSSTLTSGGEQILFVRYDRKLKQLLGVDVYTVS